MTLRTHSEPLPLTTDLTISLFKRAIELPNVMEIRVTSEMFLVSRDMDNDEDPVLPPPTGTADADAEYVLARCVENLYEPEFDPERHPYLSLQEATAHLAEKRLRVCGIMAPRGSLLADYFGLGEDEAPESFMGHRVIYHNLDEKYPDKIVLFGAPTSYFNDATHGVIIDCGV